MLCYFIRCLMNIKHDFRKKLLSSRFWLISSEFIWNLMFTNTVFLTIHRLDWSPIISYIILLVLQLFIRVGWIVLVCCACFGLSLEWVSYLIKVWESSHYNWKSVFLNSNWGSMDTAKNIRKDTVYWFYM